MEANLEMENLSPLNRSTTTLPVIKEENEEKLAILVDKLEDAISLIKLKENEIKRLDETITKLNEISTSIKIEQIHSRHANSIKDEKKRNSKSLFIAVGLTITSIIALVILMVGFGVLIAALFDK